GKATTHHKNVELPPVSTVSVCLITSMTTVDCSLYKDSGPYCTRESYPLCGTDGKTYGNQCAFCREVVKSNGKLAVQYMGKCK
uniref:Kazal-like domain-containing protein n=1 Tax=Salvator merianae TaxID=96440 RepID=A0A8D0DW31_SALMN